MKYLHHCQRTFNELVTQGYSQQEALLTISKERHPELDDDVHQEIVKKCPDVIRLANFIYNILDFRPPWQMGYGGSESNSKARALIECTTVSEGGRVNTNHRALRKKLEKKNTA